MSLLKYLLGFYNSLLTYEDPLRVEICDYIEMFVFSILRPICYIFIHTTSTSAMLINNFNTEGSDELHLILMLYHTSSSPRLFPL